MDCVGAQPTSHKYAAAASLDTAFNEIAWDTPDH